ncbi:hypothetical protein CALCODRAFT_280890 [Calocera cornea HHB12733]|uniref:Uncharacterized protein n=1 Tax=Calocera cornea HHB12733 TaxID=1353952 RepID=A0A165G0F3_9BASI|nr:hypothetical protein CALCODRAFT_280890 [Calocera cornea HHB12733]
MPCQDKRRGLAGASRRAKHEADEAGVTGARCLGAAHGDGPLKCRVQPRWSAGPACSGLLDPPLPALLALRAQQQHLRTRSAPNAEYVHCLAQWGGKADIGASARAVARRRITPPALIGAEARFARADRRSPEGTNSEPADPTYLPCHRAHLPPPTQPATSTYAAMCCSNYPRSTAPDRPLQVQSAQAGAALRRSDRKIACAVRDAGQGLPYAASGRRAWTMAVISSRPRALALCWESWERCGNATVALERGRASSPVLFPPLSARAARPSHAPAALPHLARAPAGTLHADACSLTRLLAAKKRTKWRISAPPNASAAARSSLFIITRRSCPGRTNGAPPPRAPRVACLCLLPSPFSCFPGFPNLPFFGACSGRGVPCSGSQRRASCARGLVGWFARVRRLLMHRPAFELLQPLGECSEDHDAFTYIAHVERLRALLVQQKHTPVMKPLR